jgi:hypothetical protein
MSLRRSTLRKSYHLPGEDLDYATPSIKSLRKSAGPQFTCEVCCRMMSSGVRVKHLESKPHADAVKKRKCEREREEQKITAALREREMAEVRAKLNEWTCEICNRSMHISSMDSHLAGTRHQKQLHSSPQQPVSTFSPGGNAIGLHGTSMARNDDARTTDNTSNGTHRSAKPRNWVLGERTRKPNQLDDNYLQWQQQQREKVWTCDVCNCTIPFSSRNDHLSDQSHTDVLMQRELELQEQEELRLQELRQQREAKGSKRQRRRKQKKEEQLKRQWTCDVCDHTMDSACRDMHLRSKSHVRAAVNDRKIMPSDELHETRPGECSLWTFLVLGQGTRSGTEAAMDVRAQLGRN